MKCPNSDWRFDKFLSNFTDIKSKKYPEFRKNVYYGICIWVRLFLIGLVFYNRKKWWIPYLIGLICLLTVIRLGGQWNSKRQWWSKKWHFYVCLIILLFCISKIFYIKVNDFIIPSLLLLGLFGGIIQSFFITFC